MAGVAETLRAELLTVLAANTPRLCAGLRAELARPVTLEPDRWLQFEADPWSWGITCCATEEPVFDGDRLSDELPADWFNGAEEAGVNWDALLSEEVCPWFAECWQSVGGPAQFSPAFLFLHGYHHRQYDLERRCWVHATEAFGE
jgi:hypothetical protein